MAVIFNRVAGVSQYGTTPVTVPLHLLDESLGCVSLWLRELPAGLAKELNDRAVEDDGLEALKQMVRWGVSGHDANCFLEQTENGLLPIPYLSEEAEYHGHKWPVTSAETLSMYERALPGGIFLHTIRAALTFYHIGVVPTPRLIWDNAKARHDPLAKAQTP